MPEKNSVKNKRLNRREIRDLDVKITFMEGIVRRAPEYIEALQILGDHYTQRGHFDNSLKVDKKLSRLEPKNPLVFYNLACSYSLTDQFDRVKTFQDLFPEHSQLHLSHAIAHAAVQTETEAHVAARIRTIDHERIGILEHGGITIA